MERKKEQCKAKCKYFHKKKKKLIMVRCHKKAVIGKYCMMHYKISINQNQSKKRGKIYA